MVLSVEFPLPPDQRVLVSVPLRRRLLHAWLGRQLKGLRNPLEERDDLPEKCPSAHSLRAPGGSELAVTELVNHCLQIMIRKFDRMPMAAMIDA